VGIDHGGLDATVAEQGLDGADVVATGQQLGGEGMAQRIHTLLINSVRRGSCTGFIRFLTTKFASFAE